MRKRSKNSPVLFYLVILVLLAYLFFRFGLQLFVDLAFYLTQKRSSTISSNKDLSRVGIVTEPIIDSVPHATNVAELVVSGKTNPENTVYLYQNKKQVDKTTADFEGNFEFFVFLEENDNYLYVVSYDAYSNKSLKSKTYDVLYLKTPPLLELTNIEDNKRYYQPEITIEGRTENEVFVKVNGTPVVVKADGTFVYPYTLKKGENMVVVTAEDVAGNVTSQEFKLIYVD